jgi:galactose mutarotase-like enzyme
MVPLISSIENEFLRVQASSVGAELQSIVLKQDGTEFLWQGDPTFWKGRAYNLFPICGRLWEGKYTYAGKTYEMNLHGFARKSEMTLSSHTADSMTFRLEDSEKTLAQYPFKFAFTVTYRLEGPSLKVTLGVENKDGKTMIFAVGGHPGFNVPFGGKGDFTDYELEFDNPGHVQAVAMSTACYATEHFTMMPLRGRQNSCPCGTSSSTTTRSS